MSDVGIPIVEMLVRDAFRPLEAWQIRCMPGPVSIGPATEPDDLGLFVARANGGAPLQYSEVRIESSMLTGILGRLRACAVAMPPPLRSVAVADGSRRELVIRGGIEATLRLSWVEGEVPSEWTEVAKVFSATVEMFRRQPLELSEGAG